MSDSDIPSDWQPNMHLYVDGEWVMTYRTPEGELVDESGDGAGDPAFIGTTTYVRSAEIDGERVHLRSDPNEGDSEWFGADGEPVNVDRDSIPALDAPTARYVTEDGVFSLRANAEDGTTEVVGPDGEPAGVPHDILMTEAHIPTVIAGAQLGGRQAFVALDAAGDRQLVTRDGDPVEGPVDWDEIEIVPLDDPTGDPVSIGDYAHADGTTKTVLLYADGSQAIEDDGGLQRVVVPTEVEYPTGASFFEGTFATESGELVDVFSFANEQTAIRVDGELVLLDLPITSTHPGEAPISCGPYPGGELFVFPNGLQLLRDGDEWSIGDLPDIPSFEELSAPPEGSVDSDLLDDITGLPGEPRPSPEPPTFENVLADALPEVLPETQPGAELVEIEPTPLPLIDPAIDEDIGLAPDPDGGTLDVFDDPSTDTDTGLTE